MSLVVKCDLLQGAGGKADAGTAEGRYAVLTSLVHLPIENVLRRQSTRILSNTYVGTIG